MRKMRPIAPRMVVADRLLTVVAEEEGLRMADGDHARMEESMSLARRFIVFDT